MTILRASRTKASINFEAIFRYSLYFILLLLTISATFVVHSGLELFLVGFSILSFGIISLPVFLRKDFNLFEPITFVIGLVFIGFPMKMLYILLFQQNNPLIYTRLLLRTDISALTPGAIQILLGLTVFTVGYMLRAQRSRFTKHASSSNFGEWNQQRVIIISWTIFFLSLIAFGMFIVNRGISIQSISDISAKRFMDLDGSTWGRLNSLSYYLYRLAALVKYPFYLMYICFLYGQIRLHSTAGLLLVLSGATALFFPFFLNNRAGIIVLLCDMLILYYLTRKQLNLLWVAVGFVLSLVLIFIVTRFRSIAEQDIFDVLLGTRHFVDISKTAHIVNAVPSRVDYLYGETLYGWLFSLIPQSVWPDRPISVELGQIVGYKIFGLNGSGIPPGLIGEFYMNFGSFGVIIGMFLIGLLLRWTYELFRQNPDSPSMVIIYTMITTRFSVFAINNSFGTGVLKLALDLAPLLCILWYATNRQRAKRKVLQATRVPAEQTTSERLPTWV